MNTLISVVQLTILAWNHWMQVITHASIDTQYINLILKMFIISIPIFIPWEMHETCITVYYQCCMWFACPSAYISPSNKNDSKALMGFQGPQMLRWGMAIHKSWPTPQGYIRRNGAYEGTQPRPTDGPLSLSSHQTHLIRPTDGPLSLP